MLLHFDYRERKFVSFDDFNLVSYLYINIHFIYTTGLLCGSETIAWQEDSQLKKV